jgi:hypothetical protein
MRIATPIAASVLALALAGCGGSPLPSRGTAADDARAARAVVRAWIDDDDCSVATDREVQAAYPGPEARARCEADTDTGWKAGEYRIRQTSVAGDFATVLVEGFGQQRTYSIVRQPDGRWLLDGYDEAASPRFATVGHRLRVGETWTVGGRELDVRLAVEIDRVRLRRLRQAGSCAVRARATVHSSSDGPLDVRPVDFSAVVARHGERLGAGTSFRPARLRPGQTLRGYVGFRVGCSARISAIGYRFLGRGQQLLWTAPA